MIPGAVITLLDGILAIETALPGDIPGIEIALLGVHVLAGVVALVGGFVAIVAVKGGARHAVAGRTYVRSMTVVVLTAVPLAVLAESPFLLAIAVFSGYLVFGGVRAIPGRRSGSDRAETLDAIGHWTMALAGGVMVVAGAVDAVVGISGLGPVLVVFGGIGLGLALREIRTLALPPAERVPWFRRHVGLMGGAYIATVTASVTVNLPMVPALVRWLGPTLIGVPCIALAIRRYESRLGTPSGDAGRTSTTAE